MKKLLREWAEQHKMKNGHGEVEEVTVTCREYEYHYTAVERYATGKSFGTPVYGEDMYCDSEGVKTDE
jgi:hypothetical protein